MSIQSLCRKIFAPGKVELSDALFMEARNSELVDIYNAIAAKKPDKKYMNGAIMLRAAISSFDIAGRE